MQLLLFFSFVVHRAGADVEVIKICCVAPGKKVIIEGIFVELHLEVKSFSISDKSHEI